MDKTQKILVIGASGYVGSRLVGELIRKGYCVRAAGRSFQILKQRPWANHPQVELTQFDILNHDSLLDAAKGCAVVYYLVHSMSLGQKNFAQADRLAAQNMIRVAQNVGLKRIIYLGGLGNPQSRLSKHLRSRFEVSDILQHGKIPATTLRAAMIIGTGSVSFEILRHLVERLSVMVTPLWVNTQSQPIAIHNVLDYLTGCLESEETSEEVLDIGGPDILSYRQLMDIYAEVAELPKRLIISIPFLTPRLSSYWVNWVTPIPAVFTRPLAESLRNPLVCENTRIQELIPAKLLSCREAIRMALADPVTWQQNSSADKPVIPPVESKYPGDPVWVGGK